MYKVSFILDSIKPIIFFIWFNIFIKILSHYPNYLKINVKIDNNMS